MGEQWRQIPPTRYLFGGYSLGGTEPDEQYAPYQPHYCGRCQQRVKFPSLPWDGKAWAAWTCPRCGDVNASSEPAPRQVVRGPEGWS